MCTIPIKWTAKIKGGCDLFFYSYFFIQLLLQDVFTMFSGKRIFSYVNSLFFLSFSELIKNNCTIHVNEKQAVGHKSEWERQNKNQILSIFFHEKIDIEIIKSTLKATNYNGTYNNFSSTLTIN